VAGEVESGSRNGVCRRFFFFFLFFRVALSSPLPPLSDEERREPWVPGGERCKVEARPGRPGRAGRNSPLLSLGVSFFPFSGLVLEGDDGRRGLRDRGAEGGAELFEFFSRKRG